MKLNNELLGRLDELKAKGYSVPRYNVEGMRALTRLRPQWVHFGPGNIFRAHIARAHQQILNTGDFFTGITAFAGAGSQTIARAYAPFDNLCLDVSLKASGEMDKYLVASVADAYTLDGEGLERAREIFEAPSLMLASFTITEKGYARASYEKDLGCVPGAESTMLGQITDLLSRRMRACGKPVSLVSMDNCSKNGDKLKNAVMELAAARNDWELVKYISEKVAFPWTMIDKITPRPDARVQKLLEGDGFEGIAPVVTPRGTYVAPFVNAEEKEYLVIEDAFPNGRPPLEKAGMYFTDRQTVEKTERMKVTACLNPLHTCLAVFGCLLGYDAIYKETQDSDLARVIRVLGYDEGLSVAPNPGIFTPRAFLDEVVNDRLPNPFLPDTPQRIATDTSQKVGVRFGETIKAHMEAGDSTKLVAIPLTLAGYLRYLDGTDDMGNEFEISKDPRLEELKGMDDAEILGDTAMFGADLEKAGLREKILEYAKRMRGGPGAVRRTIREAL